MGQPVEQEVARAIANRRARGVGFGPVIRRAAVVAGVFTAVVALLIAAVGPVLVSDLFGGDWTLLIAFEVLFVATMLEYLVRGVLAGEESFGAYGRLLGFEAGSRVVAVGRARRARCATTPRVYAVVLAVAPFVGIFAALVGSDGAVLRGPVPSRPGASCRARSAGCSARRSWRRRS